MPRSDLYPEPPHLTIAVYPAGSESECFAAVCTLMEQVDCHPNGTVEVAPWEAAFELRSDLAGRSSIVQAERDQFRHIATGSDPSRRPVRAGYRRGRNNVAVVEYIAAPRDDRHPIAVSTEAETLGIPVGKWRKPERALGEQLARWAIDLLQRIATQCDVLYGAIGVEYSLATPSELANGVATLPSEVYLSRRLASDAPGTQGAFEYDFRDAEMTEWPTGWFYSGWSPFNSRNVTLPQSQIHPVKAGGFLGRAMSKS
jgi:hypothetical protein